MSEKNYKWIEDAKNISKELIEKNDHSIMTISAFVGTGKTTAGLNTIIQYIEQHPTDKTFHLFVCPTIALANQQKGNNIKGKEDGCIKYMMENNIDVTCVEFDCKSKDNPNRKWPKKDSEYITGVQHVIYFICEKSLWDTPERENYWNAVLDNNESFGRLNGCIIYDEAHNYESKQKQMFGEIIINDNN